MGRNRKDMTAGETYGRLTFLAPLGFRDKDYYGLFQCTCGEKAEIRIKLVRAGKQKSCGCIKREMLQARRIHPVREKAEAVSVEYIYTTGFVTDEMLGFIASPMNFSLCEL